MYIELVNGRWRDIYQLKTGGITLYGNGTHFMMLLKPPHQIPIRFATYPFYHHW